jgi:predicted XRE-type DNA-binding protein
MASEIMKVLDERTWTMRKAEEVTGIGHANYSRIRRANLNRFALDWLLTILAKLGQDVEVSVDVRPRVQPSPLATVQYGEPP